LDADHPAQGVKFCTPKHTTWFTVGDWALGGVARNVKAFVDSLLAAQPAVGFLDELDAIPNRETIDNRGRNWWTPIITLILTEVDRLRASGHRVLLLGASNYYDRLDAALIRPGRLQRRVPVLPPSSEQEVLAIFRHYLCNDLPSEDQAKLARVAIGATPVTIEGWVKSAVALSLRATCSTTVQRISIVAGVDSGGHTATRLVSVFPTLQQVHDLATISLGGRAADIVLGAGPNVGAETDLAKATELLLAARVRQGLCDTLATLPPLATPPETMKDVEADLKLLLHRAMTIVHKHRRVLLRLADQLLEERIMPGDAVLAAAKDQQEQRWAQENTGAWQVEDGLSGATAFPWVT